MRSVDLLGCKHISLFYEATAEGFILRTSEILSLMCALALEESLPHGPFDNLLSKVTETGIGQRQIFVAENLSWPKAGIHFSLQVSHICACSFIR